MNLSPEEYSEFKRLTRIGRATKEQQNRWVELFNKLSYCVVGHIMGDDKFEYLEKPCLSCEVERSIKNLEETLKRYNMTLEENTTYRNLIRAFQKQVCKVMGEENSSRIAIQTIPIAHDVALSMGYDPHSFCRAIGYSENLLEENNIRKSKPVCTCGEDIEAAATLTAPMNHSADCALMTNTNTKEGPLGIDY